MTKDKPVIEIIGEVNSDLASSVKKTLREIQNPSTEIAVRINSRGGCITSGFSIYEDLLAYPGKKIGMVVGVAESMAAVILQACTERRCAPSGHILIHHMKPATVALMNFENDQEEAAYFETLHKLNERMINLFTKKTGKKKREIRRQCDTDKPIRPQKAKRMNLIDSIV